MLNICIINKQIAYDKTSPIRAFVCLYLNIHLYTLICMYMYFNLYNTIYKRYLY